MQLWIRPREVTRTPNYVVASGAWEVVTEQESGVPTRDPNVNTVRPGSKPPSPHAQTARMPLLDVRDAVPRIDGRDIAAPASFALDPGRIIALVGPNGVGKTSMLRCVLGLLRHGGSVRWDGTPIGRLTRRALAGYAAYLPQRPAGLPGRCVRDLLALGRVPHLPTFGGESAGDRRAVADVADRLNLTALLGRPADTLSGGQLQRARIGRALVQGAKALLLDEPDTFLDLARQAELAGLLRDLSGGGLAVLLASHDLNLAAAVADEVVLLGPDRSLTGPPRAVLTEANLQSGFGTGVRVHPDPWHVAADLR